MNNPRLRPITRGNWTPPGVRMTSINANLSGVELNCKTLQLRPAGVPCLFPHSVPPIALTYMLAHACELHLGFHWYTSMGLSATFLS